MWNFFTDSYYPSLEGEGTRKVMPTKCSMIYLIVNRSIFGVTNDGLLG
jgi:hypothetical protein